MGWTPITATIAPVTRPMNAHRRNPAASAVAIHNASAPSLASGGICVVNIHAISNAAWLVVAMIARLSPPEISGIAIASDKRPSSGI
jgi:hypothetical protein